MDRPRLGGHVTARRHVVDGQVHIVVRARGRSLQLGPREWTVLRCMDGSRDLDGLEVAARERGAAVARRHLEAFVTQLDELGLLAESDPEPLDDAFAEDKPIVGLGGFALRCDGRGSCCGIFDAVAFSELEAARARTTLPGLDAEFMPLSGRRSPLLAVTVVEGSCAYREGRACRLHARAGPEAKPMGCRTFPMRYVDVGSHIRAAPRPECACVFASALDPGSFSVDPDPLPGRGAQLDPSVHVPRLAPVRRRGEAWASAAFLEWCDTAELLDADDLAAACWDRGRAWAEDPAPDRARTLGEWASQARAFAASHRWRAAGDAVRITAEQMAAGAGGTPRPDESDSEVERVYLRARLHVGALAVGDDLALGLRRIALVLWTARAMAGDDALPRLEAVVRSHGLSPG